jgi:hypothetical protein
MYVSIWDLEWSVCLIYPRGSSELLLGIDQSVVQFLVLLAHTGLLDHLESLSSDKACIDPSFCVFVLV